MGLVTLLLTARSSLNSQPLFSSFALKGWECSLTGKQEIASRVIETNSRQVNK